MQTSKDAPCNAVSIIIIVVLTILYLFSFIPEVYKRSHQAKNEAVTILNPKYVPEITNIEFGSMYGTISLKRESGTWFGFCTDDREYFTFPVEQQKVSQFLSYLSQKKKGTIITSNKNRYINNNTMYIKVYTNDNVMLTTVYTVDMFMQSNSFLVWTDRSKYIFSLPDKDFFYTLFAASYWCDPYLIPFSWSENTSKLLLNQIAVKDGDNNLVTVISDYDVLEKIGQLRHGKLIASRDSLLPHRCILNVHVTLVSGKQIHISFYDTSDANTVIIRYEVDQYYYQCTVSTWTYNRLSSLLT
ncbi:MAG: hypothetical protein K6E51_12520 [Treponema sp.]|nr:hypothetical protein [Treponema sp.]